MRRVQVIGQPSSVGLARDLAFMAQALSDCGCQVVATAVAPDETHGHSSTLEQVGAGLRKALTLGRHEAAAGPQPFDLNVMLEHLWPRFFTQARLNVAVPNPEWFDRRDVRALGAVDHVWAKTANTKRIFERRGRRVSEIGFDSEDRHDPRVARERIFFHLSGNSPMKGTARLVRLWRQHPSWPTLVVVQHLADGSPSPPSSGNVEVISSYVPEDDLKRLQNRCAFHLCPSETEGWGHYLAEAMSVGAVTLTVDAPPMNELVTGERGILVAHDHTLRQRLAERYLFDEEALALGVEQAITMEPELLAARGAAARQWFLQNKAGFAGRVARALAQTDASPG